MPARDPDGVDNRGAEKRCTAHTKRTGSDEPLVVVSLYLPNTEAQMKALCILLGVPSPCRAMLKVA